MADIAARANKKLILSHEYFFQAPQAIEQICRELNNVRNKTTIVGYSRRQSSFIRSAFSQWNFRSQEKLAKDLDIIKQHDLNPLLFTSLERHLIACIMSDFENARMLSGQNILNWNLTYSQIEEVTNPFEAKVKCGVLPTHGGGNELIIDFCEKAELEIKHEIYRKQNMIKNASFHPYLIEALSNAYCYGNFKHLPSPHDSNEFLAEISELITSYADKKSEFIDKLYRYIDQAYWPSNLKFCKRHKLSEAYFEPKNFSTTLDIRNIITEENSFRSKNFSAVIENQQKIHYSVLAAYMSLAKDN